MPKPKATEMDSSNTSRDPKGRFLTANNGGPGRPKGSRNRLGDAFIEALAADFDEHGVATIEKVRQRDPTAYVKIISGILPREAIIRAFSVSANISVFDDYDLQNAAEYAKAYQLALSMIGSQPLIDVNPEPEVIESED
jgi:hypothetical protein